MSYLRRAIPLGYFQGKVPSSAFGKWQETCGTYRGWYFFDNAYGLDADPVTYDWVVDRYLRPMLWMPSEDWGAFVLLGWVQLCGLKVHKGKYISEKRNIGGGLDDDEANAKVNTQQALYPVLCSPPVTVVGVVDTRLASMDVYVAAGKRVREFYRDMRTTASPQTPAVFVIPGLPGNDGPIRCVHRILSFGLCPFVTVGSGERLGGTDLYQQY